MNPRSTTNQTTTSSIELHSDVTQQLVSMKELSYVKIMTKLFEYSIGITKSSSGTTNPHFNDGIILDAQSAAMRQQLEQNYSSNLTTISNEINNQIQQLQQTKSTISFANNFAQQYQPLNLDVTKHLENYDKILIQVKNLIGEQKLSISELFKKYDDKKISLIELEKNLETLKNQHADLVNQVISLFENKKTLQQSLQVLHRDTSQMLAAAKGENYQLPTPTQRL
ncbi:MAG: hypothetical protein A3F11_08145 [Gammaproteobacteria bacterium RIFCSPHIGHO2_12_FULL_37_14]|nr:MAG: hypothetical protein A3F11_08145 [Gammaproteobacteria bacterium RIFCSPHIGHO2_12_FULL_37_14]